MGKLKMYILVKDSVPVGKAIVSVAHASLGAYLKWQDDPDMQRWANSIFFKVVCKVSEADFEDAKKLPEGLVITESTLDNQEVAVAFKPREEWPVQFKLYQLYR